MEKYYKSARYINGRVRMVITDDKGDIIKNPTKEQKDSAVFDHRRKPYNKTGTCDYIKEDGTRCGKKLGPKKACKEYRNGIWTGKWLCKDCYSKDRYFRVVKSDPNNYHNALKALANSRTGNLNRFTAFGKMIIGEWITSKTLKIKDLNIERDHFTEPIDHSNHPIYGNIDTKICSYDNINDFWSFGHITHNFDNLCAICMDDQEPWIKVERAYMILEEKIKGKTVTIVSDPSKGGLYERYRIDDRPFNDTYQSADIPMYFSPFDLWKGKYDIEKR